MQRVALIGLGVMGAGMASNWLAKGFALSVFNRTPARAEALAHKGARVAATPREAAGGADFVFAMVADDDASRSVWLGAEGALEGAKRGAIIIELSTLTPDWVRELGRHAEAQGCGFLDAPVGGSRQAAESGELRFFAGGEPATFEAARAALTAVGSRMDLLGPVGAGSTWKLINNQLVAAQTAALAEALAVAGKAGFEKARISELILAGAAASPIVKLKLKRMLEQDFEFDGFRAPPHAEGRPLRNGPRPFAWRAHRRDLGRGESLRARRSQGLGRQGLRRRGWLSGRSQTARVPLGGRHCLSTAMGSDGGARPRRHRGLARLLAPAPRPVLSPLARVLSIQRALEGWPSGRRRTPGKCVYGKPYRGFESRPLRHELRYSMERAPRCLTSLNATHHWGGGQKRCSNAPIIMSPWSPSPTSWPESPGRC